MLNHVSSPAVPASRYGACMKRMMIFGLLGPPVGYIVFLGQGIRLTSVVSDVFLFTAGFWLLLPFAYIFGLIPALVCAIFDWLLSSYKRSIRFAFIGFLGGLVCFLPFTYGDPTHFRWSWLQSLSFALIGAVPAIVCSWLSEAHSNEKSPARGRAFVTSDRLSADQ